MTCVIGRGARGSSWAAAASTLPGILVLPSAEFSSSDVFVFARSAGRVSLDPAAFDERVSIAMTTPCLAHQ